MKDKRKKQRNGLSNSIMIMQLSTALTCSFIPIYFFRNFINNSSYLIQSIEIVIFGLAGLSVGILIVDKLERLKRGI